MVKTIVGGVTVSWGDYKTKDLWVAIFCYIMIMYTLHKYNDNCPGPEIPHYIEQPVKLVMKCVQ